MPMRSRLLVSTPSRPRRRPEALSEVLEVNLKELATKGDIAMLRQEMDAQFVQLEQRMTIKLGTMMVVAVGAVAALVKLL